MSRRLTAAGKGGSDEKRRPLSSAGGRIHHRLDCVDGPGGFGVAPATLQRQMAAVCDPRRRRQSCSPAHCGGNGERKPSAHRFLGLTDSLVPSRHGLPAPRETWGPSSRRRITTKGSRLGNWGLSVSGSASDTVRNGIMTTFDFDAGSESIFRKHPGWCPRPGAPRSAGRASAVYASRRFGRHLVI